MKNIWCKSLKTSCSTTNRVFWYYGICLEIISMYLKSRSFIPVGSNRTGHSKYLVKILMNKKLIEINNSFNNFYQDLVKEEIEHIQKLYEIFQHVYPETKSLHPIETCYAVLHTLTLHFDEGTNCKYTYHNLYIYTGLSYACDSFHSGILLWNIHINYLKYARIIIVIIIDGIVIDWVERQRGSSHDTIIASRS